MKIDIKRLEKGFIIRVDNETQIGVSNETDLVLKIHRLIADKVKVKDLMYFQNRKSMSIELDIFSESELNKNEPDNSYLGAVIGRSHHDFIRRTTKSNNDELFVCTQCGATKNSLNKDSKCIHRPKPFGIERFLNAL